MIKKLCKTATVTSVLTLLSGAAMAASDPEVLRQMRELSRKIESLQKEVVQLKTQNTQLQSQQTAIEAKQAAAPAPLSPDMVVTKGDLPNSFKIPGTDTSVKIGGYAKLDVMKDIKGKMGGTASVTALVPVEGSAASKRSGQFNVSARQSRVNVQTQTPTGWGTFNTFVEGDFWGVGGNEAITNSASFRLRHAYGELGPVLAGQTWTTFYDPLSAPETLDFGGPVGLPQGIRQGQLRYTTPLAGGSLALAIENPEGDFFQSQHDAFVAGTSVDPTIHIDKWPDLIARYTIAGSWGRLSGSALLRYLSFDNRGGTAVNGIVGKDSTFAGGLGVMGRLNTVGKDSVIYSASAGPGMGRYILGLGTGGDAGYVDSSGALKTQMTWGAALGYQHYWTDELRSTLVAGRNQVHNPSATSGGSAVSGLTDYTDTLHANIVWSPIPRANLGFEYLYADRKVNTPSTATLSNKGTASRVLFSAQYGF